MSVYFLADIEVDDPETYHRYVEQARPIVQQHGGRYLIQGGTVTPMSDGWNPARLIMIEFDTVAALGACFDSPEYRAIAPLREQSTRSRAIIVEGCSS